MPQSFGFFGYAQCFDSKVRGSTSQRIGQPGVGPAKPREPAKLNLKLCGWQTQGVLYPKDSGVAAVEMLSQRPNLFYISFNLSDKKAQEFGKARLQGHITDKWMAKAIALPNTPEYSATPPPLTTEELAGVPEAEIALGKFEKLTLSSSYRSGQQILIKDDARREWTSAEDEHAVKFEQLARIHDQQYANALVDMFGGEKPPGPGEGTPDPGHPDDVAGMESLDQLKKDNPGKQIKIGPSDYAGVTQVFVGDSEVWFFAAEDLRRGSPGRNDIW